MKEFSIQELLEEIAEQEGSTAEEIQCSIQEAIDAGFNNPDPEVQAAWSRVPFSGEYPTLEDLIAYCLAVMIADELNQMEKI